MVFIIMYMISSIIYDGVGHEYTTDMWQETIKWLKEKL